MKVQYNINKKLYKPSLSTILALTSCMSVTVIAIQFSGFEVKNYFVHLSVLLCFLISAIYMKCRHMTGSRIGALFFSVALSASIQIIASSCGLILSYIAAAHGINTIFGSQVQSIDAFLGFNWHTFVAFIDNFPTVCTILLFAYLSMFSQIFAIIFICALKGDLKGLDRFIFTMIVSLLLVVLLSIFVPIVGPASIQGHDFINTTVAGNVPAIPVYLELRSGSLRVVDFIAPSGVICLPSFHTVVGVLATIVALRIRYAIFAFVPLNIALFISTFVHGGHYLTDDLVGIAVVTTVWWASRYLCSVALTASGESAVQTEIGNFASIGANSIAFNSNVVQ